MTRSPSRRGALRAALAAGAAFGAPAVVRAQAADWPTRPVRLVVPYGPGSTPDVLARLVADRLAPGL